MLNDIKKENLRANKLAALNEHLFVLEQIQSELKNGRYVDDTYFHQVNETRLKWEEADIEFRYYLKNAS